MVTSYLNMWKNYANFSGRARRADYWWVALCQSIIYGILYIGLFASVFSNGGELGIMYFVCTGISGLYGLATLIPMLSLCIRRMHDIDKSGGFILVSLIPCVGGIIWLVLTCTEGTRGDNRFGSDPKAYSNY